MAAGYEILKITDGTNTINLLDLADGYSVEGHRQKIAKYKGGGTWLQSALADGRRLVNKRFDNVIETYPIPALVAGKQDIMSNVLRDLLLLLEKASDYYIVPWQDERVWLVARAKYETNTRYAMIFMGSIPDLGDPYSPAFNDDAVLTKLVLGIERGHWLSDEPGSSTCVEISATGLGAEADIFVPTESADDCWVNLTAGTINIPGVSLIFGADAVGNETGSGIRFRSVTIPPGATIISSFIRFVSATGTAGTTCNVDITGESNGTPAVFSTYADYAARTRSGDSVNWNAIPAWVGGNIYDTPDFTEIVQEIIDLGGWSSGNALVIFIEDDSSTANAFREPASWDNVTYDEAELHVMWEPTAGAGRAATCLDEVFFKNSENLAPLTHIYVDDGGVIGPNLLTQALPYNLLPAVPAVGDVIYFGCSTAHPDAGWFTNIIFDIGTLGTVYTAVWEYRLGAWATPATLTDNTDQDGLATGRPFDTAGVKALWWTEHAAWVAVDLNAELGYGPVVTAYWIRLRVTGVGGVTATQQNRHPYTVTWSNISVDEAQVGGDIPALIQLHITNQSHAPDGAMVIGYFNRLIMGLRSESRGTSFNARLNASNVQQLPGITCSLVSGAASFVLTGTGSLAEVLWNPVGVVALESICRWTMTDIIQSSFYGIFHAYADITQITGTDEDMIVELRTYLADALLFRSEEIVINLGATATNLYDFGEIELVPTDIIDITDMVNDLRIEIWASNASIGADGDLRIRELILMPADEFIADVLDITDASTIGMVGRPVASDPRRYLNANSLPHKRPYRTFVNREDNDAIIALWSNRAAGPFILQANSDQRFWILTELRYSAASETLFKSANLNSIQIWRNQRYRGLRGNK